MLTILAAVFVSVAMVVGGGLSVIAAVAIGVLLVAAVTALCLACASLFAWLLGL